MSGRTRFGLGCLVAGLLMAAGGARPANAAEVAPAYMPIGVAPARLAATPPIPLMVIPTGWQPGDVAAVLAPTGEWPPGGRERLTTALMGAGAAVLHLPDPTRPGAPKPEAAMAEALRALHGVIGVGLAVAIGSGSGGDAALEAAESVTAEGRRYAAAVRLGTAPAFRFIEAPATEGWPARAWVFCDLLARLEVTDRTAFATACQERVTAMR